MVDDLNRLDLKELLAERDASRTALPRC